MTPASHGPDATRKGLARLISGAQIRKGIVMFTSTAPTIAWEIAAHVDDASLCVTERFVAVVGPPAVGKSTVTGALADRFGARVFRLREFAHELRSQPAADQRLFDTRDSLGWLPEETVFLLLHAALLHGQFRPVAWWRWRTFPAA